MSRVIEIRFAGKESSFKVVKIDRSKLYGSKRRIPIDTHGRECAFASLTEDGRFILPKGSMALLYLDEKGEVVERVDLQAVDGKLLQVAHRRETSAEVVDRKLHSERLQFLQCLDDRLDACHYHALGDLEFQTSQVRAGLLDDARYH